MIPGNWRFWRNVALITAAHLVAIYGLARWSRAAKEAPPPSVVWLSGDPGLGGAAAAAHVPPPKPLKVSTPVPEETPSEKEEPEDDEPILTSTKSDIQLPTATPKPSPTAASTPRPKSKATATPMVKVPPKPKPKKPKPSPTPTPHRPPRKLVLAKASPPPLVKKAKAAGEEDEKKEAEEAEQIKMAKSVLEKAEMPAEGPTPEKSASAQPGSGKGSSSGGGHAGGGGGQSQFGWYGSMLHDRFYSEWVQPGAQLAAGAKLSALVRIRIEKDGRVSKFEIIKPSGNATVDESISAVANKVTEVEPLPAGLGNGDHYDIRINFELNSD